MTVKTNPNPVRKTLGLTGITINAMALTAPGAFLWLLYQVQASASFDGVADIWPGVLLALLSALLTSLSFGELARRYPEAGFRSAYHFADRFFARQKHPRHKTLARIAKFATGWSAHLYYWIYPGVMVAFMGILADYLLRLFRLSSNCIWRSPARGFIRRIYWLSGIAWNHRDDHHQRGAEHDPVDNTGHFWRIGDCIPTHQPG